MFQFTFATTEYITNLTKTDLFALFSHECRTFILDEKDGSGMGVQFILEGVQIAAPRYHSK